MAKFKVKDNKKTSDKIQKTVIQPLSKLCFSFDTVTKNNNYCFKKVAVGDKSGAYEGLFEKF